MKVLLRFGILTAEYEIPEGLNTLQIPVFLDSQKERILNASHVFGNWFMRKG